MVTYKIPSDKIPKGLKLFHDNAQDFWFTARIAAREGSLNIALGLYTYALEEIGKFTLLREGLGRTTTSEVIIDERAYKSHNLKLQKAMSQFDEWNIPLNQFKLPLSQEERQRLWFVSWDPESGEFKREFTPSFGNIEQLDELVRRGLVTMSLDLKTLLNA